MGTSLSGTYHSTVNIGQGDISSTVTVALTGDISIGFYGDDGIYAAVSVKNPIVYNYDLIRGGANGDKGGGGTGVYLASSGTVINEGSPTAGYGEIYGGTCYNNASGNGEGGGTGVDLGGGGLLQNYGIIGGGAGGSSTSHRGGTGGAGVFAEPTSNIVNHHCIYGGAGGNGGAAGGFGGDGVVLDGGSLVDDFLIRGGAGGTGGSASGGRRKPAQYRIHNWRWRRVQYHRLRHRRFRRHRPGWFWGRPAQQLWLDCRRHRIGHPDRHGKRGRYRRLPDIRDVPGQ
jgi:hypothetical protein